jgi:hypothetical protein
LPLASHVDKVGSHECDIVESRQCPCTGSHRIRLHGKGERRRRDLLHPEQIAVEGDRLRLGDQQLHLFVRENVAAPTFHHVGIDMGDIEAVYLRAQELDIQDKSAFFSNMYELPDGSVQMYIRDPAGNLLELDWPDVTTLSPGLRSSIVKLSDTVRQGPDALDATLYLTRAANDPGH